MTQAPAHQQPEPPATPPAWSGLADWRLLATRFGVGLHFLETWKAWRTDPQRPGRLHFVGLSHTPLAGSDLLACARTHPHLLILAQELASQFLELQPGFHRFTMAKGSVLLTLCVGELIPLLKEQHFQADELVVDGVSSMPAALPWSRWHAKALARCCRRGTLLKVTGAGESMRADLEQCGFDFQTQPRNAPDATDESWLNGQFNPRWALRAPKTDATAQANPPGTCAVVGAGLAGASVAAALARRGWQVQVLDGGPAPAGGASGLPVGLVVPHVSVDDCALSRLSRAGVRLMLHEAQTLLKEEHDWAPSGVMERCLDPDPARPGEPSGAQPIEPPSRWHPQAAWLKPGALVRAWLAQPGVTFMGGMAVAALRHQGGQWELLDGQNRVLTRADRVVLANACGAPPLLATLHPPHANLQRPPLPGLHGVRGLVSWAMHGAAPAAAFPPHPVNGAGSVISSVPWHCGALDGPAWFAGATYQPDDQPETADEINHATNLARVQRLLPKLGGVVADAFAGGEVDAWKGTRCVSVDRLPLVGPVDQASYPELWVSIGMGSRGLSFSMLCAELLAAQWHGEPWVIEAHLARRLIARRGAPALLSRNL